MLIDKEILSRGRRAMSQPDWNIEPIDKDLQAYLDDWKAVGDRLSMLLNVEIMGTDPDIQFYDKSDRPYTRTHSMPLWVVEKIFEAVDINL